MFFKNHSVSQTIGAKLQYLFDGFIHPAGCAGFYFWLRSKNREQTERGFSSCELTEKETECILTMLFFHPFVKKDHQSHRNQQIY